MERDQVAKCAQHCNAKRDAAKIAQEQSAHLHLCYLIDDLTKKYGPVIRDAKIVGILDSAFDVVVVSSETIQDDENQLTKWLSFKISPNFALKNVFTQTRCLCSITSMTNTSERSRKLSTRETSQGHTSDTIAHDSLYWDTKDVLSYLAAENEDDYIKKVLAQAKAQTGTAADAENSIQGTKSVNKSALKFENVKSTPGGHRIQVIEELQTLPVSVKNGSVCLAQNRSLIF